VVIVSSADHRGIQTLGATVLALESAAYREYNPASWDSSVSVFICKPEDIVHTILVERIPNYGGGVELNHLCICIRKAV